MVQLKWCLVALALLTWRTAQAQSEAFTAEARNYVTERDRTAPLPQLERELAEIADEVLHGKNFERKIALNQALFYRLQAILARPEAYDYSFDSLATVSRLYPEDQSFRIFTWGMADPSGNHTYYGIVQRRIDTPAGRVYRAIPLLDRVDRTDDIERAILRDDGWLGALYYTPRNTEFGVLTYTGTVYQPVQRQGKDPLVLDKPTTYYVLMGINQHDTGSNYKILDVIHFRPDTLDHVYFGLPVFYLSPVAVMRKVFKYSENSVMTLNYAPTVRKGLFGQKLVNMIVFDQLEAPTTAQQAARWNYGAGGGVSGLEWIDRVYDQRKGFFGYQRNVVVYDPKLEQYDPKEQRKRQREREKALENARLSTRSGR